jgi:hypothetical protein
LEPPWIGQPQFEFPRVEPFQLGMGQPEVGFRVEPPQRFGPIKDEPYREQVRFEQPYEFRNEPPRNEPYIVEPDEFYMGYERWLPSPPKVQKPRSLFNAASLAYVCDCIYEVCL